MKIWNGNEWEEVDNEQLNSMNSKNKIDTKLIKKSNNNSISKNDEDTFQSRLKKTGATIGDLATNVGKGFFSGIENFVDLGRYGVAGVADLVGAKNYANDVRERAKEDTASFLFDPIENVFNKSSALKENEIVENVAQGVGQIGTIIATGGLLPKAVSTVKLGKFAMPTTSILSGMGSGMTEAYNNDATNGQAFIAGLGSGLSEGFSESLFGGLGSAFSKKFGGGALDDVIVKRLTDKISNKTLQTLAQSGLKATGEGFEEVISGIGNAFTKKLTYMNKEDIGKLINDENLLDSFVVGTLTSAVVQTPGTIKTLKSGNSYINSNINQQNDLETINNDLNLQNKLSDNLLNENENRYIFLPTNNEKSNSLKQSASKYFNNSQDTANLVNTFDKIAREKNYNILFDDTIKNSSGNFVNAQIKSLSNGEIEIRVNPNSNRAGEFLIMHEVTHAIETDSMKKLIIDYASKNSEFNQALESLKQTYGTNDVSSEVVADISGQLFGNQEFINNLSTKQPNIFKRIYNKIVELANKITGNTKESLFIKDLKNKWEEAYRNTTTEQAVSNINDKKFSIQEDTNGNKYVNVDTDQDIFEGKKISEQTKIAKQYILEKFRENGINVNNENISVTSRTANEYTHPKNQLPTATKSSKIKASTELDNLLSISKYQKSATDDGRHLFAKDGWDYYETTFKVGDNLFTGLVNIAKSGNKKTLYDITNIKRIDQNRSTSANAFTTSLVNSSKSNISQFNENVKDTLPKYSMQNNENNTQELDNSSFSLEQRVSGDALLDAQDLIDEVKSVGANVDENGYITVYHQTTKENADKIRQSGKMIANEDSVYFSTSKNASQSEGRGQTKIEFKIPAEKLILDDIFSDNADLKVPLKGSKTLDVSNYLVNDTKYSQQNDNSSILKNSNGKEIDVSDLKENSTMERFHYNRKYDKNNIVTYRGESDNTGSNPAFYGLGLYTTLDSKYAKKYGNVFVVDNSLLPDNPLKFKTQNDFNIWEQELARELGIRKNELYSDDYGVEQYIKKLGYDGLMIGTGKDTDLISYKDVAIKYSQQNDKWQEHLENSYKTTGTRTDMKSLKLSIANQGTRLNNEMLKSDILPKYNDRKDVIDKEKITLPIKELNAIKYENNKNAIGRLEQEKYRTLKNIDDKIKSKIEEYNSKNNKDTIIANKLNQQIVTLNNQKQNIEAEYNKRITNLNKKNEKMTTAEFKINEQKYSKKAEYDQLALSNIENMRNWKDKDKGIKYKTNTMERNFYDIIPDKNEAKKIVDTYISPITKNNAESEKFITKYNKKIEKLNLNKQEAIAVQMLGEAKYIEAINDKKVNSVGIVQTAEDYIKKNNLDINKIQNAVKEFRNIYDELINKINFVLRNQGFKEIDYRKDYFPHFEEITPTSKLGKLADKLGWKFVDNEIPTSIAGITDTFKPNKIWTSFSQRRYGNNTSYNALKGFDNYIRGAADLIYHTEDIQKLRSLENMIRYQYSDKSIQDEYTKISNMDLDRDSKAILIDDLFEKVNNPLGNLVTELRSYTDGLANKKSELDRRIEHSVGRQYYNTAKNIQNRLSANMVGLNISSALTNFIPITQAWGQVSTKNLIRGMKQSISNNFREDGLVDNSVFLTNRTKQADRLYKTNLEKISSKVNVVFDAVDSFTSNTIVRAKYFDNLEKGMNNKQAMENADQFAKSLMAGRDKGSLPTIFNSKNPIVKLFTSFQLEVANQYNYMLKDIPKDLKKEGLLKLTSAFLKMFLGAWIYNKASESITGRKSAFSPIDIISETVDEIKRDTSVYDKVSSTAKNIASELPFVGGLLGGGRLPISSALPDLGTTVESITNLGDDNKRQSAINSLKRELSKPLFYVAMPFGGGQTKKTIEGISMYDKSLPTAGSYTNSGNLRFSADESVGGKIKSALFGQYSSKEAQDYIDSGYKSISKNKIQEMKDLNMTSSEYRDYQKGLSNSGNKISDKINYINSLDVSNEKKNIMANNIIDSKNYKIDMKKYEDYSSYDEMKYAYENPNKYQAITTIGFKYNDYEKIREEISIIKEKNSNSNSTKQEIFNYINSLKYNKHQKLILYNLLGGYSIKNYKKEIFQYIESMKISKEKKEIIWNQLYGGDK